MGIIGTGRIGTGLATGWVAAGHDVMFGSRDPAGTASPVAGASVASHGDAVSGADVVAIAIPYSSVEGFARDHAAALSGVVVMDISNPMRGLLGSGRSGAEVTAAAIGDGARVVAAFKANFASTLAEPRNAAGQQRDVWIAGEDASAREVVAGLIADLGFRPVDCGGMESTHVLDLLVPLIIELTGRADSDRSVSFKLLD
ncbi:MAG: NAD(P)-binding domain-containing protein [Dehalococcoidia bacterium]